jgi:uncharacterized protein (TIGR02118 family)
MVKVSGIYRWFEGASFMREYYTTEHMRITRELLIPLGLQRLESDVCLSQTPYKPGQIVAVSQAYFNNASDAINALKTTGAQLSADLHWYSNIAPEIALFNVEQHDTSNYAA